MAVNALGELLERERAKSGLGHTEFAKQVLGIDHGQLSRYINDGVIPGRETMRQIAAGLKMPVGDLEALVPPRKGDKRAQPGDETRDLIRETVHETLAQMGHPRVAQGSLLAEGELYAAAFDAAIRDLPQEYRARLPSLFRDELRRRRRAIVAQQ